MAGVLQPGTLCQTDANGSPGVRPCWSLSVHARLCPILPGGGRDPAAALLWSGKALRSAMTTAILSPVSAIAPKVELRSLDTLWFQVGGTVCNLACTHCFISCSPTNHTHEMMPLAEVERYLEEAMAL